MTKKHFVALAAALEYDPDHWGDGREERHAQWLADVDAVAQVCATFSTRFDRARFLAACGVEETK